MKMSKAPEHGFIHYGKMVLGIILIVIGVIGLFLPFLQGIVMILAGTALVGGKKAIRRCKRLAMRVVHWLRWVRR